MRMSEHLADLSLSERALFLQQLKEEAARRKDLPQATSMQAIPREKGLPLSFAQERLWFLHQLEPGIAAYNIPVAYCLKGPLDADALERSLNEIVRRHEVLRTSFEVVDGRPVQVIAPNLRLTLPVEDLRELPETEWETEAHRLYTGAAQQPFDLAQGPLLRVTLLRLGEEEHVLLLTMHHIVSDGWSMGIFNRELSTLYEAFSAGKPSPLPDLSTQYADFAVWQRQWLQGEVLEKQLSYWKQQLGGGLPVLELPTDRPRPTTQTFQGANESLVLSKDLTESLKALSRQVGVTLFMTLLAVFKALLNRCTGQEDIVVGMPIAGRNRSEIEGLIGFFVNTLVLRTDLSGNPTFRELLGRVRDVTLEAHAHQDLPFEKLVEELQPERDLSRPPLFDVMINFINIPQTPLELPGITMNSQELSEPESKYSMTLYVKERESELHVQLVYQRALFSTARIALLLDQFRYLLEQAVADPGKPIRSYSLVTLKSRPLLPDPSVVLPEPRYELVTNVFASWANDTPEHPAVCWGDRTWTYGTLAQSAQTLARTLLVRGLGQGDIVAVSGPRSFGLIASVVSVFLSGGVLLIIDQNLPANRQQVMFRETGAKYLLYVGCQRVEEEWLQEFSSLVIIDVDPDKGWAVEPERSPNLEAIPLPELDPNDAAYIFFTSGTTGVPKGVLGCHKGLSHFLNWQRKTFATRPQDRSAQLTAPSSDAVLRDIFLALTSGATLCLPEGELGLDQVLPWLEREEISLLHTVPTLTQAWLMNVPTAVSLRNLRWVFFVGESLPAALVHQWREAFPEAGEIVNLYGPTETTLVKCFYIVPSDAPPGVQPIGWPLPETQALVLTENVQLCGIGEPGEIVLRTPFRTLGYTNAPEENQKRFVKNPFRDDEKDLLYFTGDRGRYRPDGSLEILGRLDDQVKIRGVRIEPSEVTASLSQHPAVKSCVVVARKDEEGQNSLVAYVVKSERDEASPHELRRYLGKHLPAVMIPTGLVFLEQLPLLSNGKVDRGALPTPAAVKPELERTFVAPRTPVEEMLAKIWATVLGLERVGVHDGFFELGGDSLLSIQVVARAHQADLRLSPRQLFEHQTIAELATVIGTTPVAQAEQGLVTGPVPLLPSQCWFFEKKRVDPHHQNSPKLFEVQQALDASLLEEVVRGLLVHHDALRLRFVREESGWRQFIAAPGNVVPFSWVDLSSVPEAQQGPIIELAAAQVQASLNLSEGPIWRVVLFELGADRLSRLLIIVHHLAIDGASWDILLKDFKTAYQQLSHGEAIQLPPKTTSIQYWAERLVEYAQSPTPLQEMAYWATERRKKVAPLPVDHAGGRDRNTVASGGITWMPLGVEETQTMLQDVQKAYDVQMSDVLLMALVQAFAQWTGERSLLVDIVSHSREGIFEEVNLSRTVGWFATQYPVLLHLGEANTLGEALKSIKQQLRSIPNRGFGYGLLRYLHKDAEITETLRALPEAEVCFNYMGRVVSESPPFKEARESIGPRFSPRSRRFSPLFLGAVIVNDQLQLQWRYSENIHRRATIECLARRFVETLRSLIAVCQSLGEVKGEAL